MEEPFFNDLVKFEQRIRMRYVTSVERRGIEEGLQQGLHDSTVQMLKVRLGSAPEAISRTANEMPDIKRRFTQHGRALAECDVKRFIATLQSNASDR